MNRHLGRAVLILVLLWLIGWRAALTSAQTPTPTARTPIPLVNLLQNPSFEDESDAWDGYREVRTSKGWRAWWMEREGDVGYILRRPECKSAHHFVFANRVKSGEYAQQCFTSFGTHDMGLYQQVKVKSGQVLLFSIWTQVWSTSTGNPDVSELPGNVRVSIGIDPTGGSDPFSPIVHWSPEIEAYDRWHFQFVQEVAQSDVVTVFTRSRAEFAVRNNDVYWDEAGLVDADQVVALQLTPIPTATPKPTPTLGPESILYAPPVTDTLRIIAARFGVDFKKVALSNRVPGNVAVQPGLPVIIPGGQERHATRGTYVVPPGETLDSIAARFQFQTVELALLNRRFGPGITWPGETLILP
ncbi:MAG TPA: LysM peptidoglycan-binding domain-containing protein [Anaerolineae bacterium]